MTYSFLVTNTGNVTVTGIVVTDPKVPAISCPATSLAPSAFMTCTGGHVVTQAEMDAPSGTLVNTVTVKSSAPDATDSNTIPVAKDPKLTVDKTSTTTSITAAGQVVPYSFLVTNTGNVTVTGITLTDPKVPTIACDATSLAPGISMTCTGNHTVTQAEMDAASGTLVNTVTVKSSAPDATDSNTIPVAKDPKLTVDKTSTTTSITVAGQVVPYSFLVTNTGNVTVTGIALTDPKVPAITCEAASLAPGISMTCTGNHTVTQAEIDAPSGTLVNTVTVKSSAPDATDTNTITVAKDPKLTVDEDLDDDVDHDGRPGRPVQLPRDEHRQRDGHRDHGHRSEGPDDHLRRDVAGARHLDDVHRQPYRDAGGDRCAQRDACQHRDGQELGAEHIDTNTITVAKDPKLTVGTTLTTTSITAAGQVVPYSFLVTNTGNVTVTGIAVTDPKVPTITCDATSLAACGISMTCTGRPYRDAGGDGPAERDARQHGHGQELGAGRDGLQYDSGREGPEAHGRQDVGDDVDHCGRPGGAVQLPRDEHRQRDGHRHHDQRPEGADDHLRGDVAGAAACR